MTDSLSKTFHLLGYFWLEEVRPADLAGLAALPELAAALPQADAGSLTELAVEYQRLFGFNLPPYESVFIDPSAMLLAPATSRVQQLYQQASWMPPAGVRSGAPDHLGLELLALATWLEQGQTNLAGRLQLHHLAWWAPALVLTLRRLQPHPFYAALGELTLDRLLATLPAEPIAANIDPFSDPPLFALHQDPVIPSPNGLDQNDPTALGLDDIIEHLLTAGRAGFFLTREDIGRISHSLDLPPVMGERRRMLEALFRLAGQYELVPALLEQLTQILAGVDATYETWSTKYSGWSSYAQPWRQHLAASQAILAEMNAAAQNL